MLYGAATRCQSESRRAHAKRSVLSTFSFKFVKKKVLKVFSNEEKNECEIALRIAIKK